MSSEKKQITENSRISWDGNYRIALPAVATTTAFLNLVRSDTIQDTPPSPSASSIDEGAIAGAGSFKQLESTGVEYTAVPPRYLEREVLAKYYNGTRRAMLHEPSRQFVAPGFASGNAPLDARIRAPSAPVYTNAAGNDRLSNVLAKYYNGTRHAMLHEPSRQFVAPGLASGNAPLDARIREPSGQFGAPSYNAAGNDRLLNPSYAGEAELMQKRRLDRLYAAKSAAYAGDEGVQHKMAERMATFVKPSSAVASYNGESQRELDKFYAAKSAAYAGDKGVQDKLAGRVATYVEPRGNKKGWTQRLIGFPDIGVELGPLALKVRDALIDEKRNAPFIPSHYMNCPNRLAYPWTMATEDAAWNDVGNAAGDKSKRLASGRSRSHSFGSSPESWSNAGTSHPVSLSPRGDLEIAPTLPYRPRMRADPAEVEKRENAAHLADISKRMPPPIPPPPPLPPPFNSYNERIAPQWKGANNPRLPPMGRRLPPPRVDWSAFHS